MDAIFLRRRATARRYRSMSARLPRLALLAAFASLTACAHDPRVARRAPAADPAQPARAEFDPDHFQAVFVSAVDALRRAGYTLPRCDAGFGAVVTGTIELDATCASVSCLARQSTEIKLGHHAARVTLTRELWDPATRSWVPASDPASLDALRNEQAALLARILAVSAGLPDGSTGSWDPCSIAVARCDSPACVTRG
jgi:hypothetical protein